MACVLALVGDLARTTAQLSPLTLSPQPVCNWCGQVLVEQLLVGRTKTREQHGGGPLGATVAVGGQNQDQETTQWWSRLVPLCAVT